MSHTKGETDERGIKSRLETVILELQAKRKKRITRQELIEATGTSHNTLRSWGDPENLFQRLDIATWFDIARALKVHPMDLIEAVGVDWECEEVEDPEDETELLPTI